MYSLKLCKNTKKNTFKRKIIRIFAQIKSLIVISRYFRCMRSYISHHSHPLLAIGIALCMGIVTDKFLHCPLSSFVGVAITVVQLFLCWLYEKRKQCGLLIFITSFCLGFTLASIQQDKTRLPVKTYSHAQLSALDRTQLKAMEWRALLEESFRKMDISQDGYAVLVAMTLGDRSSLDAETRRYYSASGASHIMAVSGLHVGIIFQLLLFLLTGKRDSRKGIPIPIVVLAVTSIWAYTLLIGMPASAVRSSWMVTIYSLALVMSRQGESLNGLLLAAIIMLTISPSYLFDVSFQLSFSAVLAIIVLYPWVGNRLDTPWMKRHPVIKWALTLLGVSTAAQLGTMPLCAYHFGQVTCYSLLASMVAIPCASVILNGGVAYLALSTFPIVQGFVGNIIGWIMQALNGSLSFIASLPGACIKGLEINLFQLCLLYVVVIAFIHILHRYRPLRIHLEPYHKDCNSREDRTSPGDRNQGQDRHTPSS